MIRRTSRTLKKNPSFSGSTVSVNKPAIIAFKQQSLAHSSFLLTPRVLLPSLFIVATIFIAIGAILFSASKKLADEVIIDYTNCSQDATTLYTSPSQGSGSSSTIESWRYDPITKTCYVRFRVFEAIPAPVFLYIRLTKFFQNHRLYVKSKNDEQLKAGDLGSPVDKNCGWLQYANCEASGSNAVKNVDCIPPADQRDPLIQRADRMAQYYPCGLIANSFFFSTTNTSLDDISSFQCTGPAVSPQSSEPVCTIQSLSIPNSYAFSDKNIGIKLPYFKTGWATSNPTLQSQINTRLIPPPAWRKAWPSLYGDGYNVTNLPDLNEMERFHNWMRPAGMPTFRKLWGRNDASDFERGVWEIQIVDNFETRRYKGTKSLVIATASFIGSKNNFMALAFLAVGVSTGTCAIAFLCHLRVFESRTGSRKYLSWNR
ncbi:CDC50/LEM3 family [Chytridium lagenaria]|nr:CDC50/LEM3 family [Chytridium lagenaria]